MKLILLVLIEIALSQSQCNLDGLDSEKFQQLETSTKAATLNIPWQTVVIKDEENWEDENDSQLMFQCQDKFKDYFSQCPEGTLEGQSIKHCYNPTVLGYQWGDAVPVSEEIECKPNQTCQLSSKKTYTVNSEFKVPPEIDSQTISLQMLSLFNGNVGANKTLSPTEDMTVRINQPGKFIMKFKPLLYEIQLDLQLSINNQPPQSHPISMILPTESTNQFLNGVYFYDDA